MLYQLSYSSTFPKPNQPTQSSRATLAHSSSRPFRATQLFHFDSIELANHSSKRAKGIEPSPPAWKAGALPLSYARNKSSISLLKSSRRCTQLRRHTQLQCAANLFAHPICMSRTKCKWGEQDSNLRRINPTDLQSVPFGRFGIPPHPTSPTAYGRQSQRRDSNPRPTDYKSVALPTELRWRR